MTPPREEFMAALERERERRKKERCVKRAACRVYKDYRNDLFAKIDRRRGKC